MCGQHNVFDVADEEPFLYEISRVSLRETAVVSISGTSSSAFHEESMRCRWRQHQQLSWQRFNTVGFRIGCRVREETVGRDPRPILKAQAHNEEEHICKANKKDELKHDWMLAAAVIDRISAITFTFLFIGGTLFFFILFATHPWPWASISIQHWGDHWSRRRRRRGRTPKAWESRRRRGGFGKGAVPPPQKIFRLRISKWWVLMHSVWCFWV